MLRGRSTAFVFASALVFATTDARAAEPPLVAIDMSAPAACPSRKSLRDRLEARTEGARFVLGGSTAAARVDVSIDVVDGHATARITMRGAGLDETARVVDGDTCDDVLDAVALLVAVAVERMPPASPPGGERAAPAPSPAPAPTRREPALEGLLYAHGGFSTGLGPEAGPVGKLGGGIRKRGLGFAPEARAEGRFQTGGAYEGALDTRAAFSTWSAAAQGCPSIAVTDAVRFGPCLGFAAGSTTASAQGFSDARTSSRLHLAVEGGVRVAWSSGAVFLELEGWGVLPLQRYRYVFGNGMPVHHVPALAAAASAGAGVRFW